MIDLDPQGNASTHIGLKHPSELPVTIRDLLLDGSPARLLEAVQEETNIDATSKIARRFKKLAMWTAHETRLKTYSAEELVQE